MTPRDTPYDHTSILATLREWLVAANWGTPRTSASSPSSLKPRLARRKPMERLRQLIVGNV